MSIWRTLTSLVSVLAALAGLAVDVSGQSQVALNQLTVPAERLPAGCSVSPTPTIRRAGNPVRGGLWAGLPISTNPWSGTDRAVLGAIRERLGESVPVPDGPPPGTRERAAFRLGLAEGAQEGYAAVYSSGGPGLVVVVAVTFDGRSLPASPVAASPTGAGSARYRVGRTLVVVSGEDAPCSDAVNRHVRAVVGQ